MTELRKAFVRDLTLKGLSKKTIAEYVSHAARYSQYYSKSPNKLTEQEVRSYLHYLITEKKLSSSTVNKAYSSLKFLYEITLGQSFFMQKIPKMKLSVKQRLNLAFILRMTETDLSTN